MVGNQLQFARGNWKESAEKEAEERSRKMLASERKKWQEKTVSVATQSDPVKEEVVKVQKEVAVQMEVEIEKKGVGDSEDVVMAPGRQVKHV